MINFRVRRESGKEKSFLQLFPEIICLWLKSEQGTVGGTGRIEPDNADPESLTEGREKVAASVPVVIELNPAESVPGILTVVLYKTAWK